MYTNQTVIDIDTIHIIIVI